MWSFRKEIHKIPNLIPAETVINCEQLLTISENEGVFIIDIELGSGIGVVELAYEAFNIPDRFQIEWDGNIVADSKYVGDNMGSISPGNTYNNIIEYEYINGSMVATGNLLNFTVLSSDIADGSIFEPTDGTGTISFAKTASAPSNARIIVYAPIGSTRFNINMSCPTLPLTTPVVVGNTDKVQTACQDFFETPSTFYILATQSFATADKLYSDASTNTLAIPNWYSNGAVSRYWDGTAFTNNIQGLCTTEPVVLGFDAASSVNACSAAGGTPDTYFIPIGETFATATNLITTSGGVVQANPGFYSEGLNWRQWNGTAFTTSGIC